MFKLAQNQPTDQPTNQPTDQPTNRQDKNNMSPTTIRGMFKNNEGVRVGYNMFKKKIGGEGGIMWVRGGYNGEREGEGDVLNKSTALRYSVRVWWSFCEGVVRGRGGYNVGCVRGGYNGGGGGDDV
ncbi:hypothetical protein DPMN_183768 [Dreissena polymorpha]|uniref:Uncharacterized protein n=1 Tax=Dreissena polymorpha TaxID=45954 RepID=A0A9D4I5U2_DREPO|nr:hypothetical protein DPMN_183768 [Dreissena polymorpha]